jgi:hypothetical protein
LASGWYGIYELTARIAFGTPKTRGRASRDAPGAWFATSVGKPNGSQLKPDIEISLMSAVLR